MEKSSCSTSPRLKFPTEKTTPNVEMLSAIVLNIFFIMRRLTYAVRQHFFLLNKHLYIHLQHNWGFKHVRTRPKPAHFSVHTALAAYTRRAHSSRTDRERRPKCARATGMDVVVVAARSLGQAGSQYACTHCHDSYYVHRPSGVNRDAKRNPVILIEFSLNCLSDYRWHLTVSHIQFFFVWRS